MNSHLAAHQTHTSARNNDIQQILKETSFPKISSGFHWEKGGDGTNISDHGFIFWSGDLNYRIDLKREQVAIAARDGNFTYLWVHNIN